MDDRKRDKVDSSSDPTGDDGEYELEEIDPAVLRAEELRNKEVLESARSAIDIDEIYRETDRNRGAEILEDWARNFRFRFRFQVKHLLIATALLSIALTLIKLGGFWPTVTVVVMLSVAALYSYLQWEERKQEAEVDRKREEMYARRRAQLQARGMTPKVPDQVPTSQPTVAATAPKEIDADRQEATTREPFRFQFSLRTLLIAITVAAVFMCIVRILGGPTNTAMILGFIAMIGLVIHAFGFEPPQSVILGWWLLLVLYVFLGILGSLWGSLS